MTDKDRIKKLEETLAWYGEQARLCRLIHSGGDEGRHALANDGGKRAKETLQATKTLTPKDVLTAARDLLADRDHWIKGTRFRPADPDKDKPDAFCLLGAISHAAYSFGVEDDNDEIEYELLPLTTDIVRAVIDGGIMTFNDHPGTTHADVLAVLDKAIEAAS
ncbi:MAG: hypothetical protein ACKO0Z_06970 [Betaproteobacteria bacterium]